MLELYLLRHGKTRGNALGRYLGRTDEELSPEGRRQLEGYVYPPAEALFVSPMKRCRQTAALLFPRMCQLIVPALRECDFGAFENKSWRELSGNPDYQAWIDSGGALPFPGGETGEGFRERCRQGFLEVLCWCRQREISRAALVIHGGTIRSILSAWGEPKGEFYDWNPANGGGYRVACSWEEPGNPRLRILEEFGEQK